MKMLCIVLLGLVAAVARAVDIPCGVSLVPPVENKIVGGVVAKPGSWPWMVMLVDDLGYISGSGFILNSNIIVTAAQIFESWYYTIYDLNLSGWRIYAGEHDITITDPHEQYYHIRRVVIHPGYNASALKHDIAIIITEEAIQYNNHTRPACLPLNSASPSPGYNCYLPGWGGTESTGDEEVLNQVDLPILDDSVCQEHWPDYLPEIEMCAGHENGGKDFCWDDLGSPLMCKDEESGAWIAQGIAAGGGNCTLADEPGVFVDLNSYSEWVITTMEHAGYPYEY